MANRVPKFTTAATTQPTAGPPPAPAPPMSDIPSKEPRNIGHQGDDEDFSLRAMLGGRPDPEFDLVSKNFDIPRYLARALDLYSERTRRPRKDIVADGLKSILPRGLQQESRDAHS